jgi:hypothetical protein
MPNKWYIIVGLIMTRLRCLFMILQFGTFGCQKVKIHFLKKKGGNQKNGFFWRQKLKISKSAEFQKNLNDGFCRAFKGLQE